MSCCKLTILLFLPLKATLALRLRPYIQPRYWRLWTWIIKHIQTSTLLVLSGLNLFHFLPYKKIDSHRAFKFFILSYYTNHQLSKYILLWNLPEPVLLWLALANTWCQTIIALQPTLPSFLRYLIRSLLSIRESSSTSQWHMPNNRAKVYGLPLLELISTTQFWYTSSLDLASLCLHNI